MFRVSKYATNISENACSRCSTSIMDFLSICITEQSVTAVAEHRRRGCPVRQPSPKKWPSFRMPIVASFTLLALLQSRWQCSEIRTTSESMFAGAQQGLVFGTDQSPMRKDPADPSRSTPDSESGRKKKFSAPHFTRLNPEEAKAMLTTKGLAGQPCRETALGMDSGTGEAA